MNLRNHGAHGNGGARLRQPLDETVVTGIRALASRMALLTADRLWRELQP